MKKEKYLLLMRNEAIVYRAIKDNDLPQLAAFINQHGVNAPVDEGTCLHQAVFNNNISVVKFLLDKKADPNALYKRGYTPLIEAIDRQYWVIARLLIQYGADVTLKDEKNNSPLIKAILRFNGDTSLLELLLKKGADPWEELVPGYTPMNLAQNMGIKPLLLDLINKTKH
jgi:ankyrin repeat protein